MGQGNVDINSRSLVSDCTTLLNRKWCRQGATLRQLQAQSNVERMRAMHCFVNESLGFVCPSTLVRDAYDDTVGDAVSIVPCSSVSRSR